MKLWTSKDGKYSVAVDQDNNEFKAYHLDNEWEYLLREMFEDIQTHRRALEKLVRVYSTLYNKSIDSDLEPTIKPGQLVHDLLKEMRESKK